MKEYPKLLIADKDGNIFDVPFLEGVGMKGARYSRLSQKDLVKLHPDSELFMLPERNPVAFDPSAGDLVQLDENPLKNGSEPCYAVAAFPAPGFTVTHNAAYPGKANQKMLPLFSYAAVVFYKGGFYTAAVRVDKEKRQELRGMPLRGVEQGVKKFRKIFPDNRLVRHLERCALCYGCPAAKNFFLSRYECPLPTSPGCNARCIGCISYQEGAACPVTQPRISFVPSCEEIAEAALYHMSNVADPVVSFGQGCEGEPLMQGKRLVEAVKMIRRKTGKGIININTNASKPRLIKELFDSGLDSIRVSMNSVRERPYNTYYRPEGYSLKDVKASIKNAKAAGGFVSINYLVMPGFTDSREESGELIRFLGRTGIDMIQWRNLNFDPDAYRRKLKISVPKEEMEGVRELIKHVHDRFPEVMKGYFNPSRGRIRRFRRAK